MDKWIEQREKGVWDIISTWMDGWMEGWGWYIGSGRAINTWRMHKWYLLSYRENV